MLNGIRDALLLDKDPSVLPLLAGDESRSRQSVGYVEGASCCCLPTYRAPLLRQSAPAIGLLNGDLHEVVLADQDAAALGQPLPELLRGSHLRPTEVNSSSPQFVRLCDPQLTLMPLWRMPNTMMLSFSLDFRVSTVASLVARESAFETCT